MRIFTTPFAQSGDRDTVQESLQTNGVVSYQQGFTEDYGKDLTKDPDAKNIERKSFNQLMFDITDTILGIQKVGSQPWNDLLKPYSKGSTIYHGGETYFNLNDDNYNTPAGGGGTGWIPLSLIDKLNHLDDFAKKNTAVLEESGRWICGDTKFAIQWGTLTALANGKTRVGGSANYRWPMAAIFHVGATTASGHANARDGFNCSISIDSYSNAGLSLAFETNGTKSITVAQKAFWFVLGIIQE